jgi:hypothetical protein
MLRRKVTRLPLELVSQADHDGAPVLLDTRLDVLSPAGVGISFVKEVGQANREIKTIKVSDVTGCTHPSERVDLEVEIGNEEGISSRGLHSSPP